MRVVLILLAACVAATILKYAVYAIALALLIIILLGVFAAPAETFGALIFYLFARALTNHTVATLAFLGVAGLCLAITGRTAASRDPADNEDVH